MTSPALAPAPPARPPLVRRVLTALARPRTAVILIVLVLAAYPALLASRPPRAWYALRQGCAALEEQRLDAARRHFSHALALRPEHKPTLFFAARAARRAGDLDAAEDFLHRGQKLPGEPPTADFVLEWAMLRVSAGNLGEGEDFLRKAGERRPEWEPLVREALAEGYARSYRVLDAFNALERWQEQEPNNAQVFFLRGRLNLQVGAHRKATDDFRRAVELQPEHAAARRAVVAGLLEIGRYEEALTHLDVLRAADPGSPGLRVWAAQAQEGLGRRVEARRLLDDVLTENPNNLAALRLRGQMARVDGNLEEAERWLTRAADASPNDYRTLFSLALCLEEQGKTEAARGPRARSEEIKDLLERFNEIGSRLLAKSPHNPDLQTELAAINLRLGNTAAAEGWLLNTLEVAPNHGPAHATLAELYAQRGDADKAAEHKRRAAGATPPTPTVKARKN